MSKVYSSVRLFSQTILSVAAFLAIALFIFMSAVQKASAAEITVNSFDDTVATGDGCTLREAITNANNDNQSGSTDCMAGAGADSISITIAGTINLLSALPDLLSDMTIIGLGANNTTVRRGEAAATEFRIFTKNSGTTTISGLTIRDGITRAVSDTVSVLGGGIYNRSGALTLSNVVVTNNQAIGGNSMSGAGGRSFGGGIFTSAQLTISDSTVSGNFSTGGSFATTGGQGTGGGIYSENAGTITITNTVISGNTATGGTGATFGGGAFGGGINGAGTTTITLNNSQIVNNSAVGGSSNTTGGGGGIRISSPTTILSVNNSIISGNSADPRSRFGIGGGINNLGITTITDSTLSGNIGGSGGAVNINGGGTFNLIRSTVLGNTATASSTSGGIDNASGILNVTNSTISGNVTNGTDGNNGGGIRNSSGGIFGTTTLINATITNNSAAGPNGASGVINTIGTVNVKNTIIAANVNNTTTPDVAGAFISQGYNLIGNVGNATGFTATGDQTGTFVAPLDPKLTPLADNGGPTSTHALLAGSPAINAGDNTNAPAADQRGFSRIIGGTIDIGAYEFAPVKSRKRVRFF